MENNKSIINTKERALKRGKIIKEMLQTIAFYENKKTVRKARNNNLAGASKTRKVTAYSKQKNVKDSGNGNDLSEEKAFELSSEEKSALDLIIRQLQALDADEMHEITYDKKTDTIIDKTETFMDFETEFDPVMLWKDTNLDDYADLFSESEIKMLKEKQKMFLSGEFVSDKSSEELNIMEEDFADEMVMEDDFTDEMVMEGDFADEMISEDDFEDDSK